MNSLPPNAERIRARDWSSVSAIIAALIGLLALCVSAYTAYLQRQQVRAQVWPYLEPGMSGSKRELLLFNKGVGPAIIEGVQVLVDGKPQRNWKAVFHALGLNYDHHIPYSTVSGIVIPANDHIDQVLFPTVEDFNLYAHEAKRLELRLCYCSSLGDCWTYRDVGTLPGAAHQQVAQCPAWGNDQFFDNENAEPAVPEGHQETKP